MQTPTNNRQERIKYLRKVDEYVFHPDVRTESSLSAFV